MTEVSEEVKKVAFEKVAQLSIYHVHMLTEIINLASSRGAFKGTELSLVGGIYDILSGGVKKAITQAGIEVEKSKEQEQEQVKSKVKVIKEETSEDLTDEESGPLINKTGKSGKSEKSEKS